MCPQTLFGKPFYCLYQRYCSAPDINVLANLEKKSRQSDLKFMGKDSMFVAIEMSNHKKKILGRFINFQYLEHQQFVLFYLSNQDLDLVSLYNYLHYGIPVRMLSWVDVFIETFAIALSVVCSCAEVPGDPPQCDLPRNGDINYFHQDKLLDKLLSSRKCV